MGALKPGKEEEGGQGGNNECDNLKDAHHIIRLHLSALCMFVLSVL